MVTVSVIATLAGGGSAAANWGSEELVAGGPSVIATERAITPLMLIELPNGCSESWSEDSID